VELTESRVRRHRTGYIDLMTPVTHIWYLKGLPSYISIILERPLYDIENIVYFKNTLNDLDENSMSLDEMVAELDKDYKVHKAILEEAKKKFQSSSETDKDIEKEEKKKKRKNVKKRSLYNKTMNEDNFEFFSYGYHENREKVGAEILKDILDQINLENEIVFERQKLYRDIEISQIKREKSLRRLRILESFFATQTSPSWMVLTTLPVLPPDLRPMLEMEGGRLVSSDLNELYRTVIHRNNRLYEMLEIDSAPDLVIKNEKRLLQEAVDCLIDNDKLSPKAFSLNDRPLRSLSEIIEGKQGRFRQNLLGKRVDYSARSVIVVGPNLRINQCGLPFDIIVELFQPHLMELLIKINIAHTMRMARSLLKQEKFLTLKLLEVLLVNKAVLLNRAPTLHRLGVQAFNIVVVPGQAIQLHPLVCTGFNADFDGDQMAIHLPIASASELEVKHLMRTPYNFLSPSNGLPILKPSQDIIIGCYYLTVENLKSNHISLENYFSSFSEVLTAYYQKKLSLHTPVWVKIDLEKINLDFLKKNKNNFKSEIFNEINKVRFYNDKYDVILDKKTEKISAQYLRITPGRIVFNSLIEKNLNFLNSFLSENFNTF
jgi:DNA-directed RNA polymerase subunit beta'